MLAYHPCGSSESFCSTTLIVSTNLRQSVAPRKRRLPMLLLIDTWLAACCWIPDCTSCSIVVWDSESRCSIHVSGSASAGPCPCHRRESSETNDVLIGGFD